jgi:hypothetical protein
MLIVVTWIGINDLFHYWNGTDGVERQLGKLFELQEVVYRSGARNFVFFNVPPYERAPCCMNPLHNFVPFYPHFFRACSTGSAIPLLISLLCFGSLALLMLTSRRQCPRSSSPMEHPSLRPYNSLPLHPPRRLRRNLQRRNRVQRNPR